MDYKRNQLSMSYRLFAIKIWKDFIRDRKGKYFLGVLFVFLTNLMQILAPKNIGWIVDFFAKKPVPALLTGQDSNQTFLILFIVLVLSRIFINIFRFCWRITLGRQTHYAAAELRREVWEHVRYFSKEDLDRKFTKGVLMNAEASDTNSARFVFGFTLVAIADVLFLGIATFFVMAQVHFIMAIMSFVFLLFIPILVRNLSRKEVEQFRRIQDALSSFNDLSSQAVATIKLQRLTQTGVFWEKRLSDIANQHRNERLKGINLSLKYIPMMGVATIISYLVLFGLGIFYTFKGEMTVGQFVAMQGLIFLMHDPLMTMGFIVSEWKKGFTALERLAEIFLNKKDESLLQEGSSITETDDVFQVKELSFAYEDSKPIFSKLNFTLKKGARLGVIGPIGAGKSTLLNLLSGFENTKNGEILFYEKYFSQYSHLALRNYMCLVHQKPFLFADTIRENITLDKQITDEEIWKNLEIADLADDIKKFPDQLDTQLGEWGINLSGGQKQRLTLARALARSPKLLFLDDCLSAVDTITEEKILKNLDHYLKDVTLVWVAHRQSTLKYCTQILDMNQ
jgi:ATP-binding cassette subfamily B protein